MITQVPHINIRPAKAADMVHVKTIYDQAIAKGYVTADTEPVSLASREEMWITLTQKQQRPFWMLEFDSEIAALFYFRNFYDRPAYRITAEIGIYIHDDFQGKGLGKFILDFCIEQAPSLGIENILALVFASNIPSLRLFENAGFTRNGTFPDLARSANGYNTLIILQRSVKA